MPSKFDWTKRDFLVDQEVVLVLTHVHILSGKVSECLPDGLIVTPDRDHGMRDKGEVIYTFQKDIPAFVSAAHIISFTPFVKPEDEPEEEDDSADEDA